MITRTYKYRLYPTRLQDERLRSWQRACHEVQFLCVIQRRMAWRRFTKGMLITLPNWSSQGREVTSLRAELPEWQAVPADVMSACVKRVDLAYTKMRQDRKQGIRARVKFKRYPREIGLEFRGQPERGTALIRANDRYGWWVLASAKSRLGELKVRTHRPIPDGAKVRKVHITREADGWYISFACDIPKPDPLRGARRRVIGVDLGCIHAGDYQRICATSDGRIFEISDHLKKNQRRLATLQKLVSHKRRVHGNANGCDPKGKRTRKRREQIARLHQRIARQRRHNLEYIARVLVNSADVIAFEDIDWRNLRAKGGTRKKGLNRSQGSASPSLLIKLVVEKAEVAGRHVVKVPAAYTSQDCSGCGVRGESKDLGVRRWQCGACGAIHDRDVNAARNIALRAARMIEPSCRRGLRGEKAGQEAASMNREGQLGPGWENSTDSLWRLKRLL